MNFGNIADSIHAMSASIRAGFLSGESTYTRKGGTASVVYLAVESMDTLTQQMAINLDGVNLTAGFRVFTAVLSGQNIDFVSNPPREGDMIEIKIGNVSEKWWVGKGGLDRCWGYLDGDQAIWIFANAVRSA